MAQELNIGRLVRVTVNLAPIAAARRGFGTLLIIGDTADVITEDARIRSYTSLDDVADDFGLTDPEYLAAQAYFGQSPRPERVMIGFWDAGAGDPETPAEAVIALADLSSAWYGCVFATATAITKAQHVAVATAVEALDPVRIYGVTSGEDEDLVVDDADAIASQLKAGAFKRTLSQFSANAHAVASFFGRMFSVNFAANRSVITMMFKQEPGITAEGLTETQAQWLKTNRMNVFAKYDNDTAIIQYGVMASGDYVDERHGLDWFSNALQTACYNLLYQSKTKIPQTDAGQELLKAAVAGVCDEAVFNGLCAPGKWNADGVGQISRGDYLVNGYYIFSQPVALQDQSDREARKAPPIQVLLKLAGAFHELDVIVDVNR